MIFKMSRDEINEAIKESLKNKGIEFDSAIINYDSNINGVYGVSIVLFKDGKKI